MYKLIRQNINNCESAFSGANLSRPFGSIVLISKPGLSLVRKARLAVGTLRSAQLAFGRGGRAACWHRGLGVFLWNVRGVSFTSGETAPGPSSSRGAEEKPTNAQSRRSAESTVQPRAAC